MANWLVTCNTTNQKKLVVGDEPTTCPVDGCDNFTAAEEK